MLTQQIHVTNLVGALVEYFDAEQDEHAKAGTVRAVGNSDCDFYLLVETHTGSLRSLLFDRVTVIDNHRARQLENNRKARVKRRKAKWSKR